MNLRALALVILLLPTLAISATLYVPSEYPTISAAVAASTSGDEIVVAPGTYGEFHITIAHTLVLRSAVVGEHVIIDGQGLGYIVLVDSVEANSDVILQDIATINGTDGIIIGPSDRHSVTMERCRISLNAGTGVHWRASYGSSTMMLRECEVTQNAGGGIVVEPGRQLTVLNCVIADNNGTGVYVAGGDFYCRDTRIADNHTPHYGGGAELWSSMAEMSNVEFSGNSADQAGGGISMRGSGGAYYLDNCSFVDCSAPVAAQAYIHATVGYVDATFNCCEIDTSQFGGRDWESGAVAITNEGCTVPAGALDWGSVKTLFR